tara:strand:- start:564 stop:1790 length:1227 start_codon:yes stop_codon:yes gene_type:complete
MEDDFDVQNYQETVQRRPAYIESLEKALLGGIFGEEGAEGSENAGVLSGGLLQREDLFNIAPYLIAGQQGRAQPISYEDVYAEDGTTVVGQKPVYAEGVQPGDITGFGLETFGAQALSQDANNDGIPDFLGRYSPYFETAGASTTGGIESLRRGIGALGEGKTFFGPAAQYVSGGRGMYDPSQYVESYMNPYTENVIQETEKDIERQGNVARQRASAEAVGRGAFGGSRQGIQAAEVERSIMDAKSKASADLRARNYDQALAASSGAYQQAATRDLEAGRLMGGLGQSVGQLGTQYGNIAGQYGSLAGTSADIGRVYSALAPADLSFMSGVGAQERDYRQNMIDASRKEYMRHTEQALLPYSYAYGALGGTPSASVYSQQQSEYAPPTNPYVAGLGAYTTLQGINQAK